jgi:hypothetical protein
LKEIYEEVRAKEKIIKNKVYGGDNSESMDAKCVI